MRGQSGTITAVVNALAKAGIELGENGSIYPKPKGSTLKEEALTVDAKASSVLEKRGDGSGRTHHHYLI